MSILVHSNLTKKRVTLLILLVWAIAIFMGAVPTLGWNCLCNISACSSLAPIYSRSYLIFWAVSNLLAFFIMVVVYVRIYMYVKRKTNVLSPHMSGSMSRRRAPMKLMKTVMTVLGKRSHEPVFPFKLQTAAECPLCARYSLCSQKAAELRCKFPLTEHNIVRKYMF